MLRRLARFSLRHRRLVAAAWALLFLAGRPADRSRALGLLDRALGAAGEDLRGTALRGANLRRPRRP